MHLWSILLVLSVYAGCLSHALGGDAGVSGGDPRGNDALSRSGGESLELQLASEKEKARQLARERDMLKAERDMLQRELLKTIDQYNQENAANLGLRTMLSGALDEGKVRNFGEREALLLRQLRELETQGGALALEAVSFSELVERSLSVAVTGKVEQARLRVRIEDLRRKARRFNALTSPVKPEAALQKCRILAVSRELSGVVLSVGTTHGAFHGLIYYANGGRTQLRVVALRPLVTAAVVVAGNIEDLTPGMEAVTNLEQ
ncbi:MAG: hypothetical protein PHS41_00560 [Victivallaceae bacterium]|nr:hypothetical protein [Victivallaceae bacterium]